MGARRTEKIEVQLVGIHNVKVDHDLQSRVEISREHVHEFSEAILRGDQFPAVDVFWDGKKYWLADGFHRVEAHRKSGIVDVRCAIRYGTRRDAIIYSAGANKAFSIPRTAADKERAARMLFADPDWARLSASQIAAHVGVGTVTVRKWRALWCEERGESVPDTFVDARGVPQKAKKPERMTSPKLSNTNVLEAHLRSLGLNVRRCQNPPESFLGEAIRLKNHVAVVCSEAKTFSFCAAVGGAVLNRAKHSPNAPAFIICADVPRSEIVELAAAFEVEFVTVKELVGRVAVKRSAAK